MNAQVDKRVEISQEGHSERISPWLILIAVLFTIAAAYLIYAGGNYLGLHQVLSEQAIGHTLGWVPITGLLISLLIVNPVGYLLKKKKVLSSKNMVILFAMIVAGASAVSRGPALTLLSFMGLPHEAANNPMAFQPLLEKFSPLVIPLGGGAFTDREMEALMGFTIGQSSVPWDVWFMPALMWGLFGMAFYLLGLGMATVVRRRWTEVEHLRYPVVSLAIEMVADGDGEGLLGPLWRNKLMWIGFIPGFLFIFYSQLQVWFPSLPQLTVAYGNWAIFRPLYNSLRGTTLGILTQTNSGFNINHWGISPMWMGVAYLIPPHGTIISYIISHFIRIIPNYIFYTTGRLNTFTYTTLLMWDIFSVGATFGFGLFIIFLMRKDLKVIWDMTFKKNSASELDDSGEPVSYATAMYLILGSSLFIMLYVMVFLHYKLWMALLYIITYIAIILGATRMRAYAATMWVRTYGSYSMGVQTSLLPGLLGQKAYGILGLTGAAVLGEHDICERHLAPINLLECWKFADSEGVSKRTVTKGMTLLFLLGTIIFFYTALNFLYKGYGISMAPRGWYTYRTYRPLAALTYSEGLLQGPKTDVIIFFFTGVILLFFNSWMRLKYIWWPLEPVGFIWGVRYNYEVVGNFLVMGLVKSLIIRYGGAALYNKLRPTFLGLILGWAAANVVVNVVNVIIAAVA